MKIRDRNDKFLSLSNFYLRKMIALASVAKIEKSDLFLQQQIFKT